jgi:ribosomal protein S18 acetylase RimI-like enzyme
MIEFVHKSASEVTADEEKVIRRLHVRNINLIWKAYKSHCNDQKCFVILAKDITKSLIIAWGLCYMDKANGGWMFLVYVSTSYRQKGIGSALYRKMCRKHKIPNQRMHVYRHDEISTAFFDKLHRRF